eukprot:CAMPEP_0178484254 /NCGR_PEP_ID=MMETSP0696-20121128/7658_1 /TAXON_ID=265572 /ORGANISM="Extubocellulus spinifer, Strain CCMP396" /LENGTH=212 /DNA_ID=CAMNT_0020111803 /DNA_START=394 /DNA_END=1033 /DNA_ORIENTATION=+
MTDAERLYLKPCCLPGRKELRRRDPPFWTFDNMPGGGFGVKTLYCAEVMATRENDDNESVDSNIAMNLERALKQTGREAGQEDVHHGRESTTGDREREGGNHGHGPSVVSGNALFDRWTCLLKDAADTSDEAVTAKIHHCSVQQRHFQNQYSLQKGRALREEVERDDFVLSEKHRKGAWRRTMVEVHCLSILPYACPPERVESSESTIDTRI